MPGEGDGAVGEAGGDSEKAGLEKLPRIGAELVAIKRVLLRLGVEKSSPCTEILLPGTTVVVLQAQWSSDGQVRVRCMQGWVSLRAGSGEALLIPASERPKEAAAPAAEPAPAALPRDVPVGVKDGRAAAPPVSVGTDTAGEQDEQLSPQPVSMGDESTVTDTPVAPASPAAVAPASPAAVPQKVEPPQPPSTAPAAPPQGGADPAKLALLEQQLALAHQELDRLKATVGAANTIEPAELAKAAVQLTATAYHAHANGRSPSLSSASVPSLVRLDKKGPAGPVPAAGTWQGGMSPFARARRNQAEMMNARQGAWTLGSTAGRSASGLGSLPASTSPRPTTASPDSGWGGSRQASHGNRTLEQASYGNGTPRSRSASRFAGDRLDSDPLVLGEARQVKIDQWIDEWCVRHGIAGHGGVVRMGLEKAMIEPQDWVTTLRNLSDSEMLEFLVAARDAGRTERRQQRRFAAEDARVQRPGRQVSPIRWQQDQDERLSSPSPRRRRVVAYESSHDKGMPVSPQRGVNWGQPPVRESLNETGGMALQRPPSPLGSPRGSTSPYGRDGEQPEQEQWAYGTTSGGRRDNRAAVDMLVQRRASQRLSSPPAWRARQQTPRGEGKSPRFGSASTGRLPTRADSGGGSPTLKPRREGTVPLSPRKPLVWSEGLVKGARVFVEDSESPYANQYGQIVEVSQSTVKIMCDEQFHGDRPRVVRMASVVLANHPGLPKQKQRTPRARSSGRAAKTVGGHRR